MTIYQEELDDLRGHAELAGAMRDRLDLDQADRLVVGILKLARVVEDASFTEELDAHSALDYIGKYVEHAAKGVHRLADAAERIAAALEAQAAGKSGST